MKRIVVTAFALSLAVAGWAGNNVWTSAGPEGGAARAIVIDPSSPTTVYAAGGRSVWRSTNGGASWTSRSPALTGGDIRGFVLDPQHPTTLYLAGYQLGVYKSGDGGASWTPATTGLPSNDVFALAIDPQTPSTLYVGMRSVGVYKSTDGAAHWVQMSGGLGGNATVVSFAVDPTSPQTVYAGTNDAPFKTTNGGGTWVRLTSGLPASVGISSLAVDPSNPGTVYAGTDGQKIYKSVDSGATWSSASTGLEPSQVNIAALAVDPVTPTTLYAGCNGGGAVKSVDGGASWSTMTNGFTARSVYVFTVDASAPATVYAGSNGSGVLKSSDAGAHWSQVNTGLLGGIVNALTLDVAAPTGLWAGTLNGAWRSADGGSTWDARNAAQPVREVHTLACDRLHPEVVYLATWGGLVKTIDGGASWAFIQSGLVSNYLESLAVDPVDPDRVYAGTWQGVHISENGGTSWTQVADGPKGMRVLSFAIDEDDPSVVYAGTWDGLFKSTDRGATWAPAVLPAEQIWDVEIDPHDNQTLYAATYNGVFRSTNGGATWTPPATDPLDYYWALAVDPARANTLYVGGTGGVYRSSDGGVSWAPFGTGLHSLEVQALQFARTGWTLFAGTDGGGVFAYTDTGAPCTAPTITTQPQGVSIVSGAAATLSVVAAGNPAPTYQWYRGMSGETSDPIAGATSAAYTTLALVATTSYWVRLTNPCGTADSVTVTVTVLPSLLYRYVIPSVAHIPGTGGTRWRTDVAAVNSTASVVSLTLTYVNYDASKTIVRTALLPRGASVKWVDILTSLFGLDDSGPSKGTLTIDASAAVELTSRTYNRTPEGTYGQYYPALTTADSLAGEALLVTPLAVRALAAGTVGVIPGIKKNSAFRTNLGLVNLGGADATVAIKLYGATGIQVGRTKTLSVPAGRWVQQDDIFGATGAGNRDIAYATVEVQTPAGMVWAYASVIDNATGDPTTMVPVGSATSQLIPSVAHLIGALGTQWRTDVYAINPSGSNANLTLTFTNYDGSQTLTQTVALLPGSTVEWRDILVSLFGLSASSNQKGTLRVTSATPIRLASRTYNQTTTGSYGQYYPAMVAGEGLTSGGAGVIPQLEKSASFRTNVGVLNLGGAATTVLIKLYDATGVQVGNTLSMTVPAGRWRQQDDLFPAAGAGSHDIAYATVEVQNSGGEVWAYASVIDNATGDPTTIPVLFP